MESINLKSVVCPKCNGMASTSGKQLNVSQVGDCDDGKCEKKCTECGGRGHIAVKYSGQLIQK